MQTLSVADRDFDETLIAEQDEQVSRAVVQCCAVRAVTQVAFDGLPRTPIDVAIDEVGELPPDLLAAYLGVGPHMGSGPRTVYALLKG